MNDSYSRSYYMKHNPEHLCNDCVHDGIRDPSGLARNKTCRKHHDNNFPRFIIKCDDYLRGEESIVNEIEGKSW